MTQEEAVEAALTLLGLVDAHTQAALHGSSEDSDATYGELEAFQCKNAPEIARALIGVHEALAQMQKERDIVREESSRAWGQNYSLNAQIAMMSGVMTELQKERDEAQGLLASCTDLANSWARELGTVEANRESGLQKLIDRLWTSASLRYSDRDKWKALADRLYTRLLRLHDDCCVTIYGRLDFGPMHAPSEIAVLDAREAIISAYEAAKAEEAR